MADYFLGALKGLERRSKDNVLIFSDVLTERLDALVESMIGQKISDNDYLKTLELYYKKYKRFENYKGMYFCVLRMQQVARLKKEKHLQKRFVHLEFSDELDIEAAAFLKDHKNYFQEGQEQYMRIFLISILAIAMAWLIVSVLLFHIPFLWGWLLSIALYASLWVFGQNKGIRYLWEKQIQKLYPDIDMLCRRLDQSVMERRRYPPKFF